MKIRTGFVSNSSASSFCIYGAAFDFSTAQEAFYVEPPATEEIKCKACGQIMANGKFCSSCGEALGEEKDKYEVVEDIRKKFEGTGIEVITAYDSYDSLYLGKSWKKVSNDQTGAQFKKEIEDAITPHFPNTTVKFSTIEEAWNG